MFKDWVVGQEKRKRSWYLDHFSSNSSNKELTTGSRGGPSKSEKESQKEVKKMCCILSSLSPAAWGHLTDKRLNYPPALAARRIRRTRGEDERS